MDNEPLDLPAGTDYRDAAASVMKGAGVLAATHANDDPEVAARAAALGSATGIPSNVIHLDPKGFEQKLKTQVTQGIVGSNPSLAQYAGSDPMASIVSNDDWGTLDTLSGKLHALRQATDLLTQPFQKAREGLVRGGLEGLKEGWGQAEPVTGVDVTKAIPALDPNRSLLGGMENTLLSSVMNAAQLGLRGMSSLFEGTTGAIGGGVAGLTGSEALGRDIKAMTEYEMIKPEHMPGGPWLMAGHEPPAGISKELDKAKVERNETLLKGLEDITSQVQASKTWERSPELFKQFVQQHLGDRQISIAGDAVTALYGKEVPAPGDGKLGWVPNIGTKILAAAVDGSDVEVPLADWLTHVDPAVAKGLHDNVRMWPEGVTKAESTVERPDVPPPGAKWYHGTNASFEHFDTKMLGRASGSDDTQGFYFTDDPDIAKFFADHPENGRVIEADLSLEKTKVVDLNNFRTGDELKDIQNALDSGGKAALIKEAWEQGYDSVLFKNASEGKGPSTTTVVVRDPKQIRQSRADAVQQVRAAGGLEPVFRPESIGAARSDHPMIIGLDTIDPKAVGLPEGHWQKLQELAQVQYEEDMSLVQRKAEREAKKRETDEWKSNRKDMEREVEADIRAQPHIAADLFIGAGELEGQKLQQRFTLREDDLTPEQKAVLPGHYFSKNGLGIDDVAQHFGYGSGDALVEALAGHHVLKAGRSPNEMLKDMIKAETNRRMEWEHGDLPQNILTAAHDQALSDTTLNLVIEEYQGAAMGRVAMVPPPEGDIIRYYHGTVSKDAKDFTGETFLSPHFDYARDYHGGPNNVLYTDFTKEEAIKRGLYDEINDFPRNGSIQDGAEQLKPYTLIDIPKPSILMPSQIKEEAKRIADAIINKDVNSRKKLAEVSRHYSDAVKGLLSQDPQLAVMALQRRAIGAHVAKELLAREEEMAKFDKLTKSYAGRWDPRKAEGQKIAPEWSLFIRNILGKIELKNGMSKAWMDQEIANSRFTGLADFVAKVEAESSIVDLHLPIPDFLYEPGVKPLKEMTGDEFRATRDAVTAMDKIGRADQRADVAGQKLSKDEWVAKAKAQLEKKFDALPSQRKVGLLDAAAASMTSAETVFQRFDGRDPHGLFTETFVYPMAEGSNFKNRIEREESGKYLELGDIPNKKKLLEPPIIDPSTGKPWTNFTRENLHAVISNMGNNYNWKIACKGWQVDSDVMWKWVEAHSDPMDIRRAQDLGNQFHDLKRRIDIVDRNVYGVASESVVPRPFTMHGIQYEGWYHPIIGQPTLSRFLNGMPKLESEPANFWPSVYNKFLKKRTGAVQFIDLTYDSIPSRLMQEIHYLAMHEPVMNAAKLIRDQRFRDTVIQHYGKEYMEVIDNWLHSAAGDGSFSTGLMAQANKWSGILRQNVVNTQIAFNIGTMEKHGPTAFMYSLRQLDPEYVVRAIPSFVHVTSQVAPGLFKAAVMDLFGRSPKLGDSWFDFVCRYSEEIQRRVRNYQDTMMGVHQMFQQGFSLRNMVSLYGAKLVAFSDMLSAAPLWLARYRQEIARNPDDIGAAIRAADLSVRNAHGSTAVTSRPMITTGNNPVTPWLTSLYGFMGTSLQRRIEILHDVNDAYKLGRHGEINEAAKMLPQILSGLAIYVVWTGAVEEMVTGQFTDDRRGLLSKSASFLFGSVANAIIGLRDLAWDVNRGGDSAGMISTPANDFVKVLRDLKLEKTLEGHYNPLAKQNAGKLIQDTCTIIGDLYGYCPKHVGTLMRYGHDAFEGVQKPRSGEDVYRGMITGSQKLYIRR